MAKKSRLDELKIQIKENKLSGIYLMYGAEVYRKEQFIKKLSDMIDDGGLGEFNKIIIDGKNADFNEFDDAIESFPMMCEKKLVLIKDSNIFYKPKEEQKEYWSKRLDDIPDYIILIFDEKEIDKRSALYKKVSKLGVDVEFEYLNETDLVTWVEREVLSEHKKIDKSVAQYFVSICDEGMANIKNELEKLISYCGETITKTDVDKIVSKAVGVRIFELTDCIMAKNVNGALTILRDLKTVKEPAFKVLYLLSSTFDKMLKCALLMAEGNNYNDIAQKVGLAPFIVRKYTDSARGFGENYLMDRIIEAAEIDFSIKSGEVSDWDALEKYVLDSCEMVM